MQIEKTPSAAPALSASQNMIRLTCLFSCLGEYHRIDGVELKHFVVAGDHQSCF